MGADAGGWGTWEELILGGAVLRHGTENWDVVASEIRARTLYPCGFTPQACKERYADLQKRYSGSKAWFDELRKQRVVELQRILAKSEDSIRSLESNIKSLIKAEKVNSYPAGNGSSETLSPNNETSAGSFTKDTTVMDRPTTSWPCHNNLKTSMSLSSGDGHGENIRAKSLTGPDYGPVVVVRKKRGQRIRRDCSRMAEERSMGESDNLGCDNAVLHSNAEKEISGGRARKRAPVRELSCDGEPNEGSWDVEQDGLIEVFRCVAESEPAAVFRHRMDSQKRARYKKLIKQHMDIGTIKSRIIGKSIRSAKELFRDLLLVANNALVFYSRRTREYKSAVFLRQLVMREYKKHCMGHHHSCGPTSGFIPCNPPVRPRTARPRPQPRAPPCREEKVSISRKGVRGSPGDLEGNKKPGSGFDDKKPSFGEDGDDDRKPGSDGDNRKGGSDGDNKKSGSDGDNKKPGSGDNGKAGSSFGDNRKGGSDGDNKKPGYGNGCLLKRAGKLKRGMVDGQSKNCVRQRKRVRT